MGTVQYTFKGQKHTIELSPATTTEELFEAISQQTDIAPAGLKVLFKGKTLKSDNDGIGISVLGKYPDLANGAKLFVLGTTEQEIAKVHLIDAHVKTRQSHRPPSTAKKSQTVRSLDDDKYTFGDIQVLPQFSQQEKARALLERLKNDRGIVGIMKLHKWQVGSLIELSPTEKILLGYNRNKGGLIALRLRTDDLEGFRHYDAVRKVLLHELAHNVWSEHDDNFHALNRQLNKEVKELDWAANGGNQVAQDEFFDPANGLSNYRDDLEESSIDGQSWIGGTYVLGSGASSTLQALSTRELVARAAQLRQIESEKDEDGMCSIREDSSSKREQ